MKRASEVREYPIGFVTEKDAPCKAHSDLRLTAVPQVDCWPTRLVIPNTVSLYFDVVGFEVGKPNRMRRWAADALFRSKRPVRVKAKAPITLHVVNLDSKARPFAGVLYVTIEAFQPEMGEAFDP